MALTPLENAPPSPAFFLIDAMSQIYRAFYAIRGLSNPTGLPTNATYGFTASVLRLLKAFHPELIGVVFDTSQPTFRHQAFKPYKAHRKAMPEELAEQIPYIKRVCDALGLRRVEYPGFEADDLVGTLAVKSRAAGFYPVIVSNDKDFYQLVRQGYYLLQSKKDKEILLDRASVVEQFGVTPEQVPDVLGLWGDASDNMPGVPGVGEKRAKDLIRRFGNMNNLLACSGEIEQQGLRRKIQEHREAALMFRDLATIRCDVDVEFEPDSFRPREPDQQAAYHLFTELGFEGLRKEFLPSAESIAGDYQCVTTEQALAALEEEIRKAGSFSLDTETDATDPMRARLVGMSFSMEPGKAWYLPVGHDYDGAAKQLDRDRALARLKPLLEDPEIAVIGQNVKYEAVLLCNYGIALRGIKGDAMVASYLLDPGTTHNLDDLAIRHLGYRKISYKEVSTVEGRQRTLDKVPIETVTPYACEDADIALRVHQVLLGRLEEEGLKTLYDELEIPLVSVLAAMEVRGVKIDLALLESLGERIGLALKSLTDAVYELAGCRFNINSPAQLGEVLFEKMNLPVKKKTQKTKRYSTDTEVLSELARDYELPRKVLEYRQLAKLKSTYTDSLRELTNPATGRLHTSYNQTVTATGRLSSSEPNLQNIPIRMPLGREIRKAFIADEGFVIVSADYSQIELRILAHVSGDEGLCDAFHRGEDIHTATASQLYEIPPELVTEQTRRRAKALNFGIIYGMSPYGLARELGVSQREAGKIIDRYFDKYPGVKAFIQRTVEELRENGITRTLFNRVRHVPQIRSKRSSERAFAERVAVNTPIQGTAADLIKVAMIRIAKEIETRGLQTRMILQVHDELVFEIPEDSAQEETRTCVGIMETVYPLSVPLVVDVSIAKSWYAT